MNYFFYCLLLVLCLAQCTPEPAPEADYNTLFPGKPEVPSSIKQEHDSILAQVHRLAAFTDSTGSIAKKLEEVLLHHFAEEEDYVLPTLGILPALAGGDTIAKSKEITGLAEKLKSQLVHMSVEHQLIVAQVNELKQVAEKENHPEVNAFEQDLLRHAKTEEEVYFPAAILVGEYLKMKSAKTP